MIMTLLLLSMGNFFNKKETNIKNNLKKEFESYNAEELVTYCDNLSKILDSKHQIDETIVELYELAIEKGSITAMEKLGNYYYNNYTSTKDYFSAEKSVAILEKAVEYGSTSAMIILMRIYAKGYPCSYPNQPAYELAKKYYLTIIKNNHENNIMEGNILLLRHGNVEEKIIGEKLIMNNT